MRPWFDDHTLWSDNGETQARRCDHPGCAGAGEHRAPKSPHHLNDYHWFCLEHAKAWNERWDFAKGLGPDQIEQLIRFDASWQRETWPLGSWRLKQKLHERARAFRDFDDGAAAHPAHVPPQIAEALACFGLSFPFDEATLRVRYLELVKAHHPDANGGDKECEEQLKQINQAYRTLKDFLQSS